MNVPSTSGKGRQPVKPGANALDRSLREHDLPGSEAEYGFELPREAPPRRPSLWRRTLAGLVQFALVAAIAYAGYLAYHAILATAPVAERTERARVAPLVEVVEAAPATRGPVVRAWGEVRAARTLVVRPEISGLIEWVHPEITPGGRVRQGEVVARLDKRDLELAISRAEAEIADIKARILIEQGQAALGARDLTRLSRNITEEQRNLVLRKPQMAQLEAELLSAEAALTQAENALARSEVRVPFDAIVVSESVAPGTMLTQGTEAATLVASDVFHVVLAVPGTALGWIDLGAQQEVRLTRQGVWPDGAGRTGRVVRLNAGLSETGRMAELIVAVEDPLALAPAHAGAPQLLLGSFVEAEIEGAPIAGAVAIERAHLRDGDTVWVMNAEDRLEIREVDIAWRGRDRVLIGAGLAEGERVVTTPLASFAPGMDLRTRAAEVSG